ncbi:MAG: RNA polymerase sigma factor [Crocinitomicaceae bacterium]|nr:RNA polymerase sigma factor [Crocinitomicaceae bacterium]
MSEEKLIDQYQKNGDVALVAELFQRYTHLVVAVNSKYLNSKEDIEDATMQVFELLIQDLKKHEVRNFKAWLYSVVKNNALKFKKQNQAFTGFDENEEETIVGEEFEGVEKQKLELQLDQLEIKMKDLKEDQRECLKLFYLENRSYKEITDITGLDEKKVKSHIQNGKRKLKIELEKDS